MAERGYKSLVKLCVTNQKIQNRDINFEAPVSASLNQLATDILNLDKYVAHLALHEDIAVKRRKLQCSVSESRSGDSDRDGLTTTDQGTSTSSARTAPLVSTYRTSITATSNAEVSKELQAAVLQDLLECNDDTDAHLQDWVDCEAESDISFDIHAADSPDHLERHRMAKQFEKLPVHVLQASAPNATFRKASNFLAHRATK